MLLKLPIIPSGILFSSYVKTARISALHKDVIAIAIANIIAHVHVHYLMEYNTLAS